MDHLEAFLSRFGRRRNARCWSGPRPDVRANALQRAIASNVGYPVSAEGWTDRWRLQQVERKVAAQVLAFAATESLAYGRYGPPREGYRKMAAAALDAFGRDAVFLTNTADWVVGSPVLASARLTNATFEAGLIAYDRQIAMIYWVEEED